MSKGGPFIIRLPKEHFSTILDTLEDIVQQGIDLSDRKQKPVLLPVGSSINLNRSSQKENVWMIPCPFYS